MIGRQLTPRLALAGVTLVLVLLLAFTAIVLASAIFGRASGRLLLLPMAPLPFYLFALWTARSAIVRIGQGDALRILVSPMLRRIGWALFLGGLTQVFAVPWLGHFGGGRALAHYDIGAITLGAVGVTLVIVARLVGDAEADRAELDQIV